MSGAGAPEWVIREDAGQPVLAALYLRQMLGLRSPDELPALRGIPPAPPMAARTEAEQDVLEAQWRSFWEMTVEPLGHRSTVPLELVEGYDTLVALPIEGAAQLHEAILPFGPAAVAYAQSVNARYVKDAAAKPGVSYRAYASAIAEHERQVGRRAHAFELNVQVLPLAQRGVWWIGALTVAVTDGLRGDVVAFDSAIHPIIAELA